ncbi:MAG: hypothetical protein JXB19_08495 [Bacteroidales bacterium]|nr:hypothetical protein [Bacteroidales bacterium]
MFLTVISALSFSCSDNVNIWMIGDSAMVWKSPEKAPETGWRMELQEFCSPGEYPNRPDGIQDSTHLNLYGARKIAELFARSVREQKLPLTGLLK